MGERSGRDEQPSLRLVETDERAQSPQPEAAVPGDLVELLSEMLGELEAADESDSAFSADTTASVIAATIRLGTDDTSLTGQSSATLGQRQDPSEDALVSEAQEGLMATMAQLAAQGNAGAASALGSLAVYGGPLEPLANAHLASNAGQPSDAVGSSIGRAEVVSASLLSFIPGDVDELILELGYPTASDTRVGIVVMLDAFAGHQPSDLLVCGDLDGYLAELADEDLPDTFTELTVAEAMGLLHHGFWMFDHTLDAADYLDDDADLLLLRPLLDRLLTTHPRVDYEPPEVTPDERRDAIAAFTKWAAVEAPDLADEVAENAELLVDFASDQALDPLRWSQRVASDFLYFACHKVVAPPDELACLPDVVRLMIRWSHEQKGWPADLTEVTLESIDVVQPLFEADLRGESGDLAPASIADLLSLSGLSPNLDADLLEPPIGGEHPESFADDVVADEKLQQRAIAIAEEVSERALDLFDREFVTLVRRMTADLAGLPDTPIGRGRTAIWASAIVYAVAQLNEIPGGWSPLAMASADIIERLEGAPTTITNKAKTVRDLVGVDTFPPEPRYQHSTSTAATADLMASMANLARIMPPDAASPAGVGPPSGFGLPPGLDLGVELELPPGLSVDGLDRSTSGPQPESIDPASIGADCFVLRVSLVGSRPEIWRELRLPVDATFAQLHQVLQLAMGWHDIHLHVFDFGDYTVGPDMSELNLGMRDDIDEAELRLCDALTPGTQFLYLYDFGDGWEHQIVVEGVEDVDARRDELTDEPMAPFALLGGAMACPPEDCGGVWGYQELVKAMKNKSHARRSDVEEWLPAGFDPKYFDPYTVNQAVQRRTF